MKNKELLRFTTAGSVDDGKSTLIGRLLYDSKSVYSDQISSIKKTSEKKGYDYVDLSLLTDGLKSEREQGITIDVAYRYFETSKRKFIIADTPGHIQYTRNMVTGASSSNLALILIDARNGIKEQTHRHSIISSLLGIQHIIICVNKMDLVNYDQNVYEKIVSDYKKFSARLNIKDIRFIPISALKGDNVVKKSNSMKWYDGLTLLSNLENIHIASDNNYIDCRFPIQYVIRPHLEKFQDYRGYSGKISSGVFRVGDKVTVLPSKIKSIINEISLGSKSIKEAHASMSVSIGLEGNIDVSRGDMIVKERNMPRIEKNLDAILIWMSFSKLNLKTKVLIKHTSNEVKGIITELSYKIDVNTLNKKEDIDELEVNDIARVKLKLSSSIFFDKYTINRETGSFIVIDPKTNETVAAGIII